MNFLNVIFLAALPLAALPIVMHLLHRRQQRVIEWGAMHFLTDAVAEGRRFDRLEEWLLLALRVAALLVLIFALARPLVRGLSSQTETTAEFVVVVDDSLSTDREIGGKKAFDAIRENARKFLDERGAGDNVQVVMAAEGPRWLVDKSINATTEGKRQLLDAIDQAQPTRGAANFLACLRMATSLKSADEKITRRVVVFTDGQARGWHTDARAVWERLKNVVTESKNPIEFEVVRCTPPAQAVANLSIDGVIASRAIIADKENVTLTATVTNTGSNFSPATNVIWSIDGVRQGESSLQSLDAGKKVSLEWHTALKERGVHDITAKIEATDQLDLDNVDGVVVEVVESLPILVLRSSSTADDVETQFLATALGYDESKGEGEWHSLFKPTFAKLENLEDEKLSGYHAIIVNGLADLPKAVVKKLESYVQEGGGLWLMMGANIDRDDFNRNWYCDGTGLCPLQLLSLYRTNDPNGSEASIHPPSNTVAATVTLADTVRLDIDKVRFQRYYSFRKNVGQDLNPLLESGNGAPLAILNHVGKGRVIVQAFPIRPDWSDITLKKSFVVMIQDWLGYLTQPAATRFNLTAHEPFVSRRVSDVDEESAEVTLPSKTKIAVKPMDQDGNRLDRFGGTDLPGLYHYSPTSANSKKSLPFRVLRDPTESSLTSLGTGDVTMLEQTAGIRFDGSAAPGANQLADARSKEEPAWWPLLFAMIGLIVVESFMALRVSRSRFGTAAA